MDTARFLHAVPALFGDDDPDTHGPRDEGWARLADDVAGYTAVNELAVLDLAVAQLPPGESYLEVGTFKGRSLCAAVRSAGEARLYAMENFLEFGMAGAKAREELQDNLARHAGDARVELLEGDCFTLMARPGVLAEPVGVYFYDGEHTLLSHYLALAVVEPLLADEALVLVDDASWPVVQRAHALFIARHPGWEIVRRWDARSADDPLWANGLHALVFRRTRPSRLSRRDELLRRYQTSAQDRINRVAWKVADRAPGVARRGAALVMSRSRRIGRD